MGSVGISSSPVVRIADSYAEKSIDIDGDRIADLSHGDVVERYIRAESPDVVFDRFELKINKPEGDEEKLKFIAERRKFVDQTRRKIREGRQFDAVCMMSGMEESLFQIYSDADGKPMFTPEELPEARMPIRKDLFRNVGDFGKGVVGLVRSLEKLAEIVPTYLGAGNGGPERVNLLLLAKNVLGIGATDAQGQPTFYTEQNALFDRFAQGTFAVRKVEGGYDINGDDTPEVADEEVSGQTPLALYFVGIPVAKAVLSDEEFREKREAPGPPGPFEFPQGELLSFRQLAKLKVVPESFASDEVFGYAPFGKVTFTFRKDAEGNIAYDPDNSGKPGAVNELRGTSFAGPFALGQDLKARRKTALAS